MFFIRTNFSSDCVELERVEEENGKLFYIVSDRWKKVEVDGLTLFYYLLIRLIFFFSLCHKY